MFSTLPFKCYWAGIFFLLLLSRQVASATNYYSDPTTAGSMSNPGTAASPWSILSAIFAANKTFTAGDTIFLRNGNHGYAIIHGVNTGYVVIAPQPGQAPVIDRIRVSNAATTAAAYWKLWGLTIQSEATGTNATPSYYLVEIYPYATNITISGCTISSNLNTTGWTRADWRNRCNNGIYTRGKLNANYLIENNLIKNTAFGIAISSSNTVVRGNTVQNFTHDGSRVLGSYDIFEHNKIMDLIKVMTTAENHDDLFQAFTYAAGGTGQDTLKNDTIRANLFINTTDTTRAFRGNTQGIGCFDGIYLNWRIENNIVLTDHWHGISMYGAVNCSIVNNTVLDPYDYSPLDPFDTTSTRTNIGPTWIMINQKSASIPSSGNVVKNNLLSGTVIIQATGMGAESNNKTVGGTGNYGNYFMSATNLAAPSTFDLHLKATCPAIDSGDNAWAPAVDYDGVPRPQGARADLGAYEFRVPTKVEEVSVDTDLRGLIVYPNPTTGLLYINPMRMSIVQSYEIVLRSLVGQIVFRKEGLQPGIVSEVQLSDLPKGVYLLQIVSDGKPITGKVVLQ